jgi:hypothetical protein
MVLHVRLLRVLRQIFRPSSPVLAPLSPLFATSRQAYSRRRSRFLSTPFIIDDKNLRSSPAHRPGAGWRSAVDSGRVQAVCAAEVSFFRCRGGDRMEQHVEPKRQQRGVTMTRTRRVQGQLGSKRVDDNKTRRTRVIHCLSSSHLSLIPSGHLVHH